MAKHLNKATQPDAGMTNAEARAVPIPVSVAALPLPAGASTAAKQDTGNTSLASIDAKLTNPIPVSGTVATGALTDAQLRAAAVPVSVPALTKGTQGANGLSTQNLKDAGRNVTNYFQAAPVACTAAEVMQSLAGYKAGVAVAATSTPAVVTAGKTYRVNKIIITVIAFTAIGSARVNLRANLTGVAVVGSPLVKSCQVGMPTIFTAGAAQTYTFDYPDGMEFAAGTGIAVGVIGEGADGVTAAAVGKVMIAIEGYEY